MERGGEGEPVLLLLHGMGGTGATWTGLLDLLDGRRPGSWVTFDLPGHGGSPRSARYAHVEDPGCLLPVLDRLRP